MTAFSKSSRYSEAGIWLLHAEYPSFVLPGESKEFQVSSFLRFENLQPEKMQASVISNLRCGLVHLHKQALRRKGWKRQIKATKQPTFMVSLTRPPWCRYNKRLSFAPSEMFQCHLCIILKDSELLNYASCYSSGLSSIFNRKFSSICGFYFFSFWKAAITCMS